MNNINFEEIKEEHLQAALDIYTHYVLNTTATFHAHALTIDEMRQLVIFENEKYRTFMIKQDKSICGYVIMTQYKTREAYNSTAEVTVYLKPEYIGKGIGSLALQYIEAYARTKDIHALIATICGENQKSIKLFERNGYVKCAHFHEIGKKFGQLLDIVQFEKLID